MKKLAFLLLIPMLLVTSCQNKAEDQQMRNEQGEMIKSNKPFEDFVREDLKEVVVEMPPKEKVTLSEAQITEFIELINEIVTYEEVAPETLVGQTIFYYIDKQDGSEVIIENLNPYIVIDDVWYKTEYEPCEALNQFAVEAVGEE